MPYLFIYIFTSTSMDTLPDNQLSVDVFPPLRSLAVILVSIRGSRLMTEEKKKKSRVLLLPSMLSVFPVC